jgi:surface carbohydrate biosynthesis protein
MATIALPIEIKAREFHGKLWLAAKLAEAGHRVALGDKGHLRRILYEEVRPDLYISKTMCKGGGVKERFSRIQDCGGAVAILDAEGGIASSKDDWFETRVWEELLEYVDGIFAWGEMHAEAIREGTTFPSESVYLTGNPRFDLLRPELRKFYTEQVTEIERGFGDYVLFNSNFGTVNPFSETNQEEVLSERDIEIDKRRVEYRSALFDAFLSMIVELNDRIAQDIIVRPHPGENRETYHSEFDDVAGIHVEQSGDVRPWILGSDAVLHNNCTTGIESALLNRQVIAFQPNVGVPQPDKFSLPNHASHSAATVDEVVQYIESASDDTHGLSDEQISKLEYKLANVTELAAPRMVKAVEELTQDGTETTYPSLSFERQVKSAVKSQPVAPYIQRLRGHDGGRTGKRKQKIPELTLEEVESNLAKLNVRMNQIEVDRVTYIDDVYWIDGSSSGD